MTVKKYLANDEMQLGADELTGYMQLVPVRFRHILNYYMADI
jgi:hypothetical protein